MAENINMRDANLTETIIAIAYSSGLGIGNVIKRKIKTGELNLPTDEIITLTPHSFHQYAFALPLSNKILAKIGSPTCSTAGNFAVATGGAIIFVKSGEKYYFSNNRLARVCYGASCCFSGIAFISGSAAGFSNKCGITTLGMFGDSMGTFFYWAGNKCQMIGDSFQNPIKKQDKKWGFRQPASLIRDRRPITSAAKKYFGRNRPVAFLGLDSSTIAWAKFDKVVVIGGTIFAIYGYGKFLISTYRYGLKLAAKLNEKLKERRKLKNYKKIQKIAIFLVKYYNSTKFIKSRNRIYKIALC